MFPLNGQLQLSSSQILLFGNGGTCVSRTSNFSAFQVDDPGFM